LGIGTSARPRGDGLCPAKGDRAFLPLRDGLCPAKGDGALRPLRDGAFLPLRDPAGSSYGCT